MCGIRSLFGKDMCEIQEDTILEKKKPQDSEEVNVGRRLGRGRD